jgi:hypothetical protein
MTEVSAVKRDQVRKQVFLRDAVSTFLLSKDRIVIGSVTSSDVRLVDSKVSPIHAVIELSGPEAIIFDLASEAGVWVNGEKIVSSPLRSGDEVRIGDRKLKFMIEQTPVAIKPEDISALLLEDSREVHEIFDWRPSDATALEVVMSWEGVILDVEHFLNEQSVTVGETRKADFAAPFFSPGGQFELITHHGDDFKLSVLPGSKGVIQRVGRMQRIEELKESQVLLQTGDFAKMSVGTVDFYLSFTAAPPKLKRRKIWVADPFFFRVLTGSLGMTLALLLAMLSIQLPPPDEPIPETLDRVYKYRASIDQVVDMPRSETKPPEEPATPKKPQELVLADRNQAAQQKRAELAKRAESQAKEGAGARAKGKEGQRGSPKAPKTQTPQNAARRPSPQGGKGAGGAQSQVSEDGNVEVLKAASGRIQDLLASSSQRLGKAGSQLQGFGGFTSQGQGGLALSGSGKGGGGTADSLGGLSDHGTGGGRVGTGKGAAGSGSGIVGGRSRVALQSGGDDEAVVKGSIDSGAILAAIEAHRDEFRYCYEREINAYNPKLSGTVIVSVALGSSGRVTGAGVHSTTLNNSNVEKCVLGVMKRIEFPMPRGGGTVQFRHPFKFAAVNNK